MIFRRFVVMLVLRLVLTGLAMTAFIWLILLPGYHSATVLAGIMLLLIAASLWRFVSRTNREVARFGVGEFERRRINWRETIATIDSARGIDQPLPREHRRREVVAK